jgi:hypothetical protein
MMRRRWPRGRFGSAPSARANQKALEGVKSVTASRSELGVRTDKSWAITDAIFTRRGGVAWAHDFNTDRNSRHVPDAAGRIVRRQRRGAGGDEAALTTASAEMKWLNGFSVAAADFCIGWAKI